MSNYFVGVDFHKNYSYIVVQDKFGQTVRERKITNSKDTLCQELEPYSDSASAVLEAGRNWTLMHGWLENIVAGEVKVAHPLKVKAIAEAKIKTDKIDASILAHLLRCNLLPCAYVPSQKARMIRAVLRQRLFYVRLQTMVKNRIRTIYDHYTESVSPTKNLFAKRGIEWLKNHSFKEIDKQVINQDIKLLEELRARINESNQLIAAIAAQDKRIKFLESIPGIGTFFATLIAYEIDDINRFPNAKKLSAYVGLVPATYSSGNRTYHGRIIKQGNKWLRWALVEAVWPAIRKDKELRDFYARIKKRKGANPAKVATARRLLAIVYQILKYQRFYEVRSQS